MGNNHTVPLTWILLPRENISKTQQICHRAELQKHRTARGQEKKSVELHPVLPLLQLSNVRKTQGCPKFCTSRNTFWQWWGLWENMRNRSVHILLSRSFTFSEKYLLAPYRNRQWNIPRQKSSIPNSEDGGGWEQASPTAVLLVCVGTKAQGYFVSSYT